MPKYRVTSPTGETFEVNAPDGASDQDVMAYAQSQFSKPAPQVNPRQEAQQQQMGEMSGLQKFLAGAGKAPMDIARGFKQIIANTPSSQAMAQREIDEARKLESPLMETGAGAGGNVVGNIATMIPAAFVPGANTVAGAGVIGALSGALTPTSGDESRLKNVALGAGMGAGSQYGIGKLAGAAQSRLANKTASEATRQAQNAERDAVLKASREAGYSAPPSMTDGPLAGRILEGISGKEKTAQAYSIKNQNLTQKLANKALGLAEDAPLNAETVRGVRMAAIEKGYKPIDELGVMATDDAYKAALTGIKENRTGAARSFPALKNEGLDFLENLKVDSFHASDARKTIQILRDDASKAFATGDKELGKANLQAAKAIEDQVERALEATGKPGAELLNNFRDARTMIAKTGDVEKALAKGKGKVNGEVFAAALRKGKPLTGELRTIAEFADKFGEVAKVPKQGWSNPFTVMDAFSGSLGTPLLPFARVASRQGLLSGAGQKLATPSYGPGAAEKLTPEMLEWLKKYGAGGLLGSGYAAQQ